MVDEIGGTMTESGFWIHIWMEHGKGHTVVEETYQFLLHKDGYKEEEDHDNLSYNWAQTEMGGWRYERYSYGYDLRIPPNAWLEQELKRLASEKESIANRENIIRQELEQKKIKTISCPGCGATVPQKYGDKCVSCFVIMSLDLQLERWKLRKCKGRKKRIIKDVEVCETPDGETFWCGDCRYVTKDWIDKYLDSGKTMFVRQNLRPLPFRMPTAHRKDYTRQSPRPQGRGMSREGYGQQVDKEA